MRTSALATRFVAPVILAGLALAGCAAPRESMPARLEVSAASCARAPDLTKAMAFAAPKDGTYTATVRFDDGAACLLDAAGSKNAYVVLALPPVDQPAIVTVTSLAMGQTIFSPRLALLDEKGALLRAIGRDAFMFNGSSLQTQFRQRPGEQYLVIASDSATAGKTVEQIQSLKNTTPIVAGPVVVPVSIGAETKAQLIFAHNGEVTATVAPMPKADAR